MLNSPNVNECLPWFCRVGQDRLFKSKVHFILFRRTEKLCKCTSITSGMIVIVIRVWKLSILNLLLSRTTTILLSEDRSNLTLLQINFTHSLFFRVIACFLYATLSQFLCHTPIFMAITHRITVWIFDANVHRQTRRTPPLFPSVLRLLPYTLLSSLNILSALIRNGP